MPETTTDDKSLDTLVEKEKEPLLSISTVFPFTLFPDRVDVYRSKVILTQMYLPMSKKEFPILINDVKTVTVTTGPLFASLTFEIEGYEQNPDPVPYFKRSHALEARKLITGLVIMQEKDITTTDIDSQTLIKKAKTVGQA